jgi:hypothetical protein
MDLLGGSRVSNASTATGDITGDILFGATSGAQVNTLETSTAYRIWATSARPAHSMQRTRA